MHINPFTKSQHRDDARRQGIINYFCAVREVRIHGTTCRPWSQTSGLRIPYGTPIFDVDVLVVIGNMSIPHQLPNYDK